MDLALLKTRFDAHHTPAQGSACWLWTASTAGKGYGQLKVPGERRQVYAHRLSWLLHRGALRKGQHVLHRCDTPRCVNPDHLFLGSPSANAKDMASKGRHLFGARNARAKLTEANVLAIRRLAAEGRPQREIAGLFGVAQITVSRIARRERWAHVPDPTS